jgi:group I intron endonuclease
MDTTIPQIASDEQRIPSTPGIYKIVNLTNQHFYVGSATRLNHRKHNHFRDLKAGKHKNAHLQRAYDLYGADAFLFIVIEHVDHIENLLEREQHYIDTLNPEYNISRTAGSNLGVPVKPETKEKMRITRLTHPRMTEQMEKLNADRRGKKLSPEHRAKITANQLGKTLTPEHKAKISTAQKGKKKTPEHAARIPAAKLGKKRPPEVIAKMNTARLNKKSI